MAEKPKDPITKKPINTPDTKTIQKDTDPNFKPVTDTLKGKTPDVDTPVNPPKE